MRYVNFDQLAFFCASVHDQQSEGGNGAWDLDLVARNIKRSIRISQKNR